MELLPDAMAQYRVFRQSAAHGKTRNYTVVGSEAVIVTQRPDQPLSTCRYRPCNEKSPQGRGLKGVGWEEYSMVMKKGRWKKCFKTADRRPAALLAL
jgi:hypothetical protein